MGEAKKRGRRRNALNPKIVESDRIIAKTVYRLCLWAFPVREVCEVVGQEARTRLNRQDNAGRPLGPDRIKQIFDAWSRYEKKNRNDTGRWPLQGRSRFTKDSLVERRPNYSIRRLAADLLSNQGEVPYPKPLLALGDFVLSPKAAEEMGCLSDRAMDELVARVADMLQMTDIGKLGREFCEQMARRCAGIAYRADALGVAPHSLKRGN